MKRLLIRIAALTTVVVLGVITIAQAQRTLSAPASVDETQEATASRVAADAPQEAADTSVASSLAVPSIEYRGQIADDEADDDIPDAHELAGLQQQAAPPRQLESTGSGAMRDPFGLTRAEAVDDDTHADGRDELPAYEPGVVATPVADRRYGERQGPSAPDELSHTDPTADDAQWDEDPARGVARSRYTTPAADGGEDSRYSANASQPVANEFDVAGGEAFEETAVAPRQAAPPAGDPFESPQAKANVLRRASSESSFEAATTASQDAYSAGSFDDPAQRPFVEAQTGTSSESEGTGRPGAQELEGMQIPTLSMQKLAPEEVQVGKAAVLKIEVRNIGQVPAHEVTLRDEVPQGARVVSSNPPATQATGGQMSWSLGTLRPGDEAIVEVQFVPTREGELGSVATLQFAASASVRTIATRPQLTLDLRTAEQVMIGEQVTIQIDVNNIGTGAARSIVIDQPLPAGLAHPAGTALEYEVGDLAPGESRQIELVLDASKAGPTSNLMQLRSDGQVHAEQRWELEVVAPELQVAMEGSKRRFLEREATYTFAVANPGTAPARDIELVTYLPRGMKFVEANNYGQYDPEQNAVFWSLEELPMKEKGEVTLTAIPTEPGELRLAIHGTAERGLTTKQEETILVEGVAAILFQVVDVADPIEVGGETTYEIQVLNQGTSSANNIRLRAILPDELKPTSAEGPTRHLLDGQVVTFDPLTGLAPKAETTYRIKAHALRAGDSRIRVQLLTDELQTPVTKEESTRVFAAE